MALYNIWSSNSIGLYGLFDFCSMRLFIYVICLLISTHASDTAIYSFVNCLQFSGAEAVTEREVFEDSADEYLIHYLIYL